MKDANGETLNVGDRVYTYDLGYDRIYGVLKENNGFENVSQYYVEYDDGQDCAVLDFNFLWKA